MCIGKIDSRLLPYSSLGYVYVASLIATHLSNFTTLSSFSDIKQQLQSKLKDERN